MSILKDLFDFDSDEVQLTDDQIMSSIFELSALFSGIECDCAKEITGDDDDVEEDIDDDVEEDIDDETVFLKRFNDEVPFDAKVTNESVAYLKDVKIDNNTATFKLDENDKSYRMPIVSKDNKSYIELDIRLNDNCHRINFMISESDNVKFDISKADIS